ncbi:MAG TPA: ABC transporter ATP-binding protein [Spirochaetales bacterium]|nr:ABC transporter ATP-binding protein [Spirochaetales bacterium]HRY53320.1 ABC transporter ATP-binding protein [Spirochaetia bacterium]HRZ64698.1 ABC transporter ATP-binding protein [Spirochaetia bacterium]
MRDLRKLLAFVRPYRGLAALSLLALLAMVALSLALPRLVERLIDEGVRRGDLGETLRTAALMLGLSALSALATVLNSNWSIRVGESVGRDLREAAFAKILSFSHADMDRFSTGQLMVRLTSDAGAVQRLFQISLRIGTRAPLTMIGCIALMIVTSPLLAAAMLPILLGSIAVIARFSARMEPLYRSAQGKLDRLNTVLQENIAGARLVKAFVRAGRESERFELANGELAEGTASVMRATALLSPLLTFLVNLGIVLVVWLGGIQSAEGRLSLGRLVAFANYLLALLHPLTMLSQLSNVWANGMASAKRLGEVLDRVPSVADAPDAAGLPEGSPFRLEFKGVSFRYAGEASSTVLDSIEAAAEPGSRIALLGSTGSGKSTLANLIPRFYDPVSGRVEIDGIDLRRLRRGELLGRIAMVPQESILFSGTIRENICYGKPEAGEAEAVAAAKAAQAHGFILGLPRGYESRVEERGVNLSGGQRQRLAIARALLLRPRILILDDATSAVDVETEARIHEGIAALLGGSTCFIVAQRISTVLGADKILVLDEGRIVAEGRHAELLGSSTIYREIYDSQLGGGLA